MNLAGAPGAQASCRCKPLQFKAEPGGCGALCRRGPRPIARWQTVGGRAACPGPVRVMVGDCHRRASAVEAPIVADVLAAQPHAVEQLGTAFGKDSDLLGTEQLHQLRPSSPPSPAPTRLMPSRFSSVSFSPSHPHRTTVRNLPAIWNVETVLYAVEVAAGHGEDVGTLAIGVVDDHVEHRHAAQRRRALVAQDQTIPVLAFLTVRGRRGSRPSPAARRRGRSRSGPVPYGGSLSPGLGGRGQWARSR